MSRFGAALFGCAGLRLTSAETAFFRDANPFGFILFGRNIENVEQVRALCGELRSAVGWHAPIFTDQEGGRVQRFRAPMAREWLAPLDHVAQAGSRAIRVLELRYQIIALELRALGLDGNCVPTLDVARPQTHPFLRNRCLGDTAQEVTERGRAVAAGTLAGGVLPVFKHIPGHGRALTDSHLEVPSTDAPLTELAEDFAPFRALSDLPLGMTGHVIYSALDDRPATVSPVIQRMIREDIGFDGFLMTDDLSMEALTGTTSQRAAASVVAGCDAVLHCNGKLDEMQAVAKAAGQMTATSQARAERALAARQDPVSVDIAALSAELEALESSEQLSG